jgi:hypothetical protein
MLGIPAWMRQTPLLKKQEYYKLVHRLFRGEVDAPQREIDQAVNNLLFWGPICFGAAHGVYLTNSDGFSVVHVE